MVRAEPLQPGDTVPAITYRPQQHTWNSLTPNLGLNYKVSEDILVYYKYSEAFKSGNYNGLNINNPPTRVEPVKVTKSMCGSRTSAGPTSAP